MKTWNIGDLVYWNDPDQDLCSGYYIIEKIKGDILTLTNDEESLTEVYPHELSEHEPE